jgi:histone H3/H4
MARIKGAPKGLKGVPPKDAAKGRGSGPAKDVAGPSKRRFKPGTKALREIRKLQKTTDQLLAHAPFIRTVREIAAKECPIYVRFTRSALDALQEGSEAFLVQAFGDFQYLALHRDRVTITVKDVNAAKRLGCLGPAFKDHHVG